MREAWLKLLSVEPGIFSNKRIVTFKTLTDERCMEIDEHSLADDDRLRVQISEFDHEPGIWIGALVPNSLERGMTQCMVRRDHLIVKDDASISCSNETMLPPDDFRSMWDDQAKFMRLLVDKRGFPNFPLDLTKKEDQRFIKGIIQDATGELYEAIGELRNSKRHRASDVPELDRPAYVEELVDAMKFILEILLLSGISYDEFQRAFYAKSDINERRISEGY